MNIEISKDEFEKLIDLLYIADSILTSHKTDEDPRTKRYEQLLQKVFGLAVQQGLKDKITYDTDLEKYFPTAALEASPEVRALLDEYADETFWHELMYRFTDRDLERQVGGPEKLRTLTMEDRFELEMPIEERYSEEFSEYGIERLEIVERFTPEGVKTSD